MVQFTTEQLKTIYQAVRYYQIHAVPFDGIDHKKCDDILKMTFDHHYTQNKEQPT